MKNSMYGVVAVAAGMLVAVAAFAQVGDAAAYERAKEEVAKARSAAQENLQNIRAAAKETVAKERAAAQEGAKDLRERARETLQAKREAVKDEVKKAREAAQEKIKANREALKKQAEKIKDERKRALVERLGGKFDELNGNRTEHFGDVLEKLSAMMSRIDERVARAKAAGKDVAAVEAASAAAKKAIADAEAAVKTQAEKVYKVTVSGEAKAREEVKAVRDAYHADIKALEAKVKAAREAVQNVARELAKIPGIGEFKTPAPAPAPAPAAQ